MTDNIVHSDEPGLDEGKPSSLPGEVLGGHEGHSGAAAPWPIGMKAITFFVASREASRDFYAGVLGLSPIHEDDASAVFSIGGLLINLLERGNEVEFIAPTTAGAHGSAPLMVPSVVAADVDAAAAHAEQHGARIVNGPETKSWGVRSAVIADPDGHLWEICD
ncbi:VOC family protein [Micrococcales bacterium 31B]|nr:VOC family protein [Micrococcales bacterium 31B]